MSQDSPDVGELQKQLEKARSDLATLRTQAEAASIGLHNQVENLKQELQRVAVRPATHVRAPTPPRYDGRIRQGGTVQDWLFQVDNLLKMQQVPEASQVPFGVALLERAALTWYRSQSAASRTWNWAQFSTAIAQAFTPVDDTTTAREQLDLLRQGRDSAAYYCQRFRQLQTRVPTLSEPDLIHRFTAGLRSSIAQHVRIQRPATLELAMQVAVRADDTRRPQQQLRAQPPAGGDGVAEMEMGALQRGQRQQPRSGQQQQPRPPRRQQLRIPARELAKLREEGRCFLCRETGHQARNCPRRSKN